MSRPKEVRLSNEYSGVAAQRLPVLRLAAYNAFEATKEYQEKLTLHLANTAGTVTLNRAAITEHRADPQEAVRQPEYPAVQPMASEEHPNLALIKGTPEQVAIEQTVVRPEWMSNQVAA